MQGLRLNPQSLSPMPLLGHLLSAWSLLVSAGRSCVAGAVLAEQSPLQWHSPWTEGCVAGIMSSSSLSEEELGAVTPEAWAFLVVFTAWTCSGVAGTAGPRLWLTEAGGDLIALKNKNGKPDSD